MGPKVRAGRPRHRVAGRAARGLARVISDGFTTAYLQDVLIHPHLQRRGIARELLARGLVFGGTLLLVSL